MIELLQQLVVLAMAALASPFAMLWYGMTAHFLKRLIEYRQAGFEVGARGYFRARPYHTLLSIIGGLAGFSALYGTDELTRWAAFGVGYMADSVLSVAARGAEHRLERMDDG